MSDRRKGPRAENLLLPKLLEVLGQIEQMKTPRLPTDEATTTQVLSPLLQALMHAESGPQVVFGLMARSAALFLVDDEEFAQAVVSAGPAPRIELPPLPYPKIAVECSEDATFPLQGDDGAHTYDLEIFSMNETIQGERWDVCYLLRVAGTYDNPEQTILMFEVYRDGSVVRHGAGTVPRPIVRPDHIWNTDQLAGFADQLEAMGMDELFKRDYHAPDSSVAISLRSTPLEFAHLVNARGVTTEQVSLPRAQRRRLDRFKISHPSVYFVQIGEASESHPGSGDREYHHRWLVRGHWRHFSRGGRTWVRPYIKGPAGAPWKGRPVYVLPLKETA